MASRVHADSLALPRALCGTFAGLDAGLGSGMAATAPGQDGAVDINIVVPAYNASAYLDEFFSSLFAQSFQGFRLIFVDDCSTDDTAETAKRYGAMFGQRFVYVRNDANMGLSASRNVGLEWASAHPARYLSFLDADDWVEADYLASLHDAALAHEADLAIGGLVRFDDEEGRVLAVELTHCPRQVYEEASSCDLLAFANPCAYAKLYRFDAIRDLRFRAIARSEDTCYLFEALPLLPRLVFTNRALYRYRVRQGSLSAEAGMQERASMHEHFAELLPLFEHGSHAPFKDQFECQVFIRSSLGGVMRQSKQAGESLASLAREERLWLDECMPAWRNNPYLQPRRAGEAPRAQFGVGLAALAYKLGLFPLAVRMYRAWARIAKKEVRF